MKKLLAVILASVMVISLAACGGNEPSSTAVATQTTSEPPPATAQAPEEDAQATEEAEPALEEAEPADGGNEDLGEFHISFAGGTTCSNEYDAINAYMDAISAASDGNIQWEYYPSGSALSSQEMVDGLSAGITYCGRIDSDCYPTMFSLSNVVTFPLQGFDDNVKATKVLWDLYNEYPEVAAEWENYKVLQLYVYPSFIFKTEQLPADISEMDWSYKVCGICFNLDFWNQLPAQYQEIIESLSGYDASIASAEAVQADTEEWLDFLSRGGFKTTLESTDEAYGEWQAACDGFAASWAEEVTASTGVDGATFLALAQELYAGY